MEQTLPSLADTPGTHREYETIYVIRPNTTNDQVANINGKVRNIIEKLGGKVLQVDNWGKRRLAYEVEKERRGIYLYWQYLAGPGIVEEFERNMRLLDDVIRYMTVKLADNVNAEEKAQADEEAYERAANTAADEEDMFLRGSQQSSEDYQASDKEAQQTEEDNYGEEPSANAIVQEGATGENSIEESSAANSVDSTHSTTTKEE